MRAQEWLRAANEVHSTCEACAAAHDLIRTEAGTVLVGSPDSIADRLQEYADIGVDTIIGLGYPHLEEAYRVAELLFSKLNLPHLRAETLPAVLPFMPPVGGNALVARVT